MLAFHEIDSCFINFQNIHGFIRNFLPDLCKIQGICKGLTRLEEGCKLAGPGLNFLFRLFAFRNIHRETGEHDWLTILDNWKFGGFIKLIPKLFHHIHALTFVQNTQIVCHHAFRKVRRKKFIHCLPQRLIDGHAKHLLIVFTQTQSTGIFILEKNEDRTMFQKRGKDRFSFPQLFLCPLARSDIENQGYHLFFRTWKQGKNNVDRDPRPIGAHIFLFVRVTNALFPQLPDGIFIGGQPFGRREVSPIHFPFKKILTCYLQNIQIVVVCQQNLAIRIRNGKPHNVCIDDMHKACIRHLQRFFRLPAFRLFLHHIQRKGDIHTHLLQQALLLFHSKKANVCSIEVEKANDLSALAQGNGGRGMIPVPEGDLLPVRHPRIGLNIMAKLNQARLCSETDQPIQKRRHVYVDFVEG